MKHIVLVAFGFALSQHSLEQENPNYIDSLSSTMLNIKDELVKIKEASIPTYINFAYVLYSSFNSKG